MGDINAYALGLELQIQATSAFQTVDKLKTQISSLQKAVASAPSMIAGSDADSKNVKELAASYHNLGSAIGSTKEFSDAAYASHYQMGEGIGAFGKNFANLHKEFKENSAQAVAGLQGQLVEYAKLEKLQHGLTEAQIEKREEAEREIKTFKEINKHLDDHQEGLTALQGIYGRAAAGLANVSSSAAQAGALLSQLGTKFGLAAVATALFTKSLIDVATMQEAFTTVNFRALGTQREMIMVANNLRTSLGATAEEAKVTMVALSEAGFNASHNINELASANYKFSQATGVSSAATASYQRRIVALTGSAAAATTHLARISAAIRNSGLSASESSSLMGQLDTAMLEMSFLHGADNAAKMGTEIVKFAAAAKAAGGSASVMANHMQNLMTNAFEGAVAFGALNVTFDQSDPIKSMNNYLSAAAVRMDEARKLGPLTAEAMASAFRVSKDQAGNLLLMSKAADKAGVSMTEYVNRQQAAADIDKDFSEASASLARQLKQLLEPLMAIGAQVMDIIVPALTMVLRPLTMVVGGLGSFINALQAIPGAGLLVKAAIGVALLIPLYHVTRSLFNLQGAFGKFKAVMVDSIATGHKFAAVIGVIRAQKHKLSLDTLRAAKAVLFGSQIEAAAAKGGALNIVERFAAMQSAGRGTEAAFRSARSAASGAIGVTTDMSKAATAAGGGLASMGGGAMQAAMGLAKAHPILTAIVAAAAAVFLIGPKIFEMFNSGDRQVRALAVALGLLTWPIVATYVSLKALWAILKGIGEAFMEVMADAFDPLIKVFDKIFGGVQKTGGVIGFLEKAMTKLASVTKAVFKVVFIPFAAIIKLVGTLLDGLVFVIGKIWSAIKGSPVIKGILDMIDSITKFMNDWFGDKNKPEANVAKTAKVAQQFDDVYGLPLSTDKAVLQANANFVQGLDNIENAALNAGQAMVDYASTAELAAIPNLTAAVEPLTMVSALRAPEPIVHTVAAKETAQNVDDRRDSQEMIKSNKAIREVLERVGSKLDDKLSLKELVELLKHWLPKISERGSGGFSSAINSWTP